MKRRQQFQARKPPRWPKRSRRPKSIEPGETAAAPTEGGAAIAALEEGGAGLACSLAIFASGVAAAGVPAAAGAGAASPKLSSKRSSCGRSFSQPSSLAKRSASSLEGAPRSCSRRAASPLQPSSEAGETTSVPREVGANSVGATPFETSRAAGAGERDAALISRTGGGGASLGLAPPGSRLWEPPLRAEPKPCSPSFVSEPGAVAATSRNPARLRSAEPRRWRGR